MLTDNTGDELFIDSTHQYISDTLLYLPHTIDNFFANERSEIESNRSTFRLSVDTIFSEGGNIGFDQRLRAKVIMPHSKERLRLTIESSTDDTRDHSEQGNSLIHNETGDQQQSAFLEAVLKETDAWRLSTNIGLKLHTPVDPFIRMRGRREWHFPSFQTRLTNTLFKYKYIGSGIQNAFDFEYPFDNSHLLRIGTSGTWWVEIQTYKWGQYFSYFKTIDNRRAMAYNLTISGSDLDGNQIDSVVLDMRFRKRIHHQWLFYELSPALTYPRTDQFSANWSLTLRLEILFGKRLKSS